MHTDILIRLTDRHGRAIARVLAGDAAGRGYLSTDGEIRDAFLRRALALAKSARAARARARRRRFSRVSTPRAPRQSRS